MANWAKQSESARRITDMVRLAQSEVEIAPETFDADPWLFCCANGVIDLKTGELLPHAREYFITKVAPVEYDPDATFDLWDEFLDTATGGDTGLAAFLARAIGCSLTGQPADDDKFFFVHGPPGGGKTTLIEAVKAVFGGYCKTADFDSFIQHRRSSNGPRQDIARLHDARLVTAVEVTEGKKFDETTVSKLSGGDTITSRFMYLGEFEYRAKFKLLLAGNHEPRVQDPDSPIWRRVIKIPFDRVIPEGERDPAVRITLRDDPKARAAILAWGVAGCLEWQKKGLAPPARVKAATETYRAEQDSLAPWIETHCVVGAEFRMDRDLAYNDYIKWADYIGLRRTDRLELKTFSRRLTVRFGKGTVKATTGGKRIIQGIALRAKDEYDDAAAF